MQTENKNFQLALGIIIRGNFLNIIIDGIQRYISEKIIIIIPKLFISLIIFILFYLIALVIKKITVNISKRIEVNKGRIIKLIGSILKILFILIGIITALGTVGVDVTAMVAGLGLTGFALGFAIKDALSNLLAGVLLLFYQPFKCGDRIKVSGCEGIVIDINLRYTKLKSENTEFLIPNSTCFVNWIAIEKK